MRDPMVAREVLVGVAIAFATFGLSLVPLTLLAHPPLLPVEPDLEPLVGLELLARPWQGRSCSWSVAANLLMRALGLAVPSTTVLTGWIAPSSWCFVGISALLAVYGLYYATAGRPLGRWKPLEL